jgi:cell division protein FtsW (lipid II flippase)
MDYAHNHHNLRAIIYFLARSPVRDFIWVGVTALLFALIVAYARRPNSDSTAWAIIWIAAFVSAPYLHFYDLTLLILPAAFLIKSAEDLGAAVALGLITLNILFVAHASLGIPTLTSIPLLAFLLWMVVVDRPFAPAVALGNNAH